MKKIYIAVIICAIFTSCSAARQNITLPPSGTNPPLTTAPLPRQFKYYIKEYDIYRQDETGYEIMVNSCYAPFVIDGLDTYYHVYHYMPDEEQHEDNGIYRLDSNNNRQKLSPDYAHKLYLKDDCLYYNNRDGIFKIGKDNQKIQLVSDICYGFAMTNDYIFYTSAVPFDYVDYHEDGPGPPQGKLCRSDLNGENIQQLNVIVSALTAEENYVFYVDEGSRDIYQMDAQNLTKKLLYQPESFAEQLAFYDGMLYFINFRSVACVSIQTEAYKLIKDGEWNSIINLFDGYLYFTDSVGLYRLNCESHEVEAVVIK